MTRIAVIGGGIAGLAAARRLLEAGHDTTVYEASARAGGVVGTTRVDGFLRETAATAVLGSAQDGLVDLAGELGVPMQQASRAARHRWIWIDGALKPLPSGPIAFLRSDLLTWRGKLAMLREPLRAKRDAGVAGDESMYDFAVRRLGPEAARALVAPFVTGVYAADAHDVSLASGFPALAELDARGGLVRGSLFRRHARRAGPKRRGLYAPEGGMQAIVDALAASLGSRVRLASPVVAIAPSASGVEIWAGSTTARFDGAVLAISASAASRLLAAPLPALSARLASFVRAPAAIVYLGVPTSALPRGADGFGFLVAQGEALRVLGVVMESVVWPDRAPPGSSLLRCIFAGARDPSAFALDDAALIAQARADLEVALGLTAAPVHASVVRWSEGVAQMPVGHRDRLSTATTIARANRLILAGAGMHGVGVNDLVADARRIAAEAASWT